MDQVPLPPRAQRLLLATDLSARCDRALDRAAILAAEWSARLTVVHALEPNADSLMRDREPAPSWRRDPDLKRAIATKQIRQDLGQLDVPFDVVIEEGLPPDVIMRVVNNMGGDLVVTGIARGETFGRFIFGGTVDHLVRSSTVPVLVVKARARHSYREIVVATDFSEPSRRAIVATVRMFPNALVTLLHCYESLSTMRLSAAADASNQYASRQHAIGEYNEFLNKDSGSLRQLSQLPILFERGAVDYIIKAYAADKPLDLVVIGSQGKNTVTRALFGSTAELIMASAPADVLVVPPRA